MSTLTLATITLNVLMGAVYIAYGTITLIDVRRNTAARGVSHLGYAFAFIMYTCGPHHLDHAYHLAIGATPAVALDLVTVGLGLPVGLTWFLLRVEALRGGPGDRVVRSEGAVEVYRWVWAAAFVLIGASILAAPRTTTGVADLVLRSNVLPNLLLVVLYLAVGVVLLRTQLMRHAVDGTWSMSGLALTAVFPSCAGMHAMLVASVASGAYAADAHLLAIDTLSVPATLYFLVVIWLLSAGRLPDWAEAAGDVARPAGAEEVALDELLVKG